VVLFGAPCPNDNSTVVVAFVENHHTWWNLLSIKTTDYCIERLLGTQGADKNP
jgi:hypothetical protein